MKKIYTLCLATFALSGLSHAAITPALVGSPTGGGPDYTWNYEISVDALEQLYDATATPCSTASDCGAFFTIYDFQGYVAGSIAAPSGWSTQVEFTGLTNATQNPTDDPSVVNLTFVYTGSPNPDQGPISDMTGFSAESIYSLVNTGGTFTYQAEKLNGTIDAGIGSIDVPTVVPEPATMGLISLGLIGLGLARRKPLSKSKNS